MSQKKNLLALVELANIKQEGELIKEFIKKYGNTGYFKKDVEVGFSSIPQVIKDRLQTNPGEIQNYTRKIDLLWQSKDLWILEAKIRMDMKALGQLICYKELYLRDHQGTKKSIKLGLICCYIDPILKRIYDKHDIRIFQTELSNEP